MWWWWRDQEKKKEEKETVERQTSDQPVLPHCPVSVSPALTGKSDHRSAHSGSLHTYELHQLGLRPEEIVFVGSQGTHAKTHPRQTAARERARRE